MYNKMMPKQLNYTLTTEELAAIQVAMKSHDAKVAKRANVIHSLHLGYSPEAVAELQQVSLGTVYNHVNRFKRDGVNGLANRPKSGRPPVADQAFRKRLVATIETPPHTMGLGFAVWTLPSLQAYLLRETGIKLSQNRLSEVLKEEGYVYRRPKKDLGHKHDPELRQQVQQAIEEVKKVPRKALLSYSIWMKVDSA